MLKYLCSYICQLTFVFIHLLMTFVFIHLRNRMLWKNILMLGVDNPYALGHIEVPRGLWWFGYDVHLECCMYSKVKWVGLAQIQRTSTINWGEDRVVYDGVVDLVVDVEYKMTWALRWVTKGLCHITDQCQHNHIEYQMDCHSRNIGHLCKTQLASVDVCVCVWLL